MKVAVDTEIFKSIPQLRDDIEVTFFDKTHFLVVALESRRNFIIDHNTESLLGLIDNKRNVEEIVKEYNSLHYTDISNEVLYKVLSIELSNFVIFSDGAIQSSGSANITSSYLQFSFTVISEKRLRGISSFFSKLLYPKSKLFYLFLLTTGGIVIIYYLAYIKPSEISLNLSQVPVLFILLLLNDLFHEIGHASACTRFGVNHGRIGFGFYLMTPVFFADVSEAWKLDRLKRIIINVSGMYFELIFCLLIILLLIVTGHVNLLILPIVLLVKTIFNLNPFLRTDGYWVLSDALNVPNLRRVSNDALKRTLYNMVRFRENVIFYPKDLLLSCYSILSFMVVGLYIFLILKFYSYQALNFLSIYPPQIKRLLFENGEIKLSFIFEFMLVISFYLFILFSIGLVVKQIKSLRLNGV